MDKYSSFYVTGSRNAYINKIVSMAKFAHYKVLAKIFGIRQNTFWRLFKKLQYQGSVSLRVDQ